MFKEIRRNILIESVAYILLSTAERRLKNATSEIKECVSQSQGTPQLNEPARYFIIRSLKEGDPLPYYATNTGLQQFKLRDRKCSFTWGDLLRFASKAEADDCISNNYANEQFVVAELAPYVMQEYFAKVALSSVPN
jgi:hypothetical protein